MKADTGAIGGDRSEEFQVLAQSGEDQLAVSDTSDYAANIEVAETGPQTVRGPAGEALEKVATPTQKTCEEVAQLLQVPLSTTMKLIVVKARDEGLVALAVRGDHTLNAIKAAKHPRVAAPMTLADDEEIRAAFGCEPGFLGPINVQVPIIADHAAAALADFICGANEAGFHLRGVNWVRDVAEPETADLRNAEQGDPSPDGHGNLRLVRGIEVGQIFQNGPLYTKALGVTVLDEAGAEIAPTAGCYGIGVTRTVGAVIEQCHDDAGIIWPETIAPWRVAICIINPKNKPEVNAAADALYDELRQRGIETCLDDRGLRAGAMFADIELIGIPHRVVVSERGLAAGTFEYRARRDTESRNLGRAELLRIFGLNSRRVEQFRFEARGVKAAAPHSSADRNAVRFPFGCRSITCKSRITCRFLRQALPAIRSANVCPGIRPTFSPTSAFRPIRLPIFRHQPLEPGEQGRIRVFVACRLVLAYKFAEFAAYALLAF